MVALETLQSSPHQVGSGRTAMDCPALLGLLSTLHLTLSPFMFCPSLVNLMFLMSYWSVNRSTSEGVEALQMALHTLRMMALGGIHDHVAQVHTCLNLKKQFVDVIMVYGMLHFSLFLGILLAKLVIYYQRHLPSD